MSVPFVIFLIFMEHCLEEVFPSFLSLGSIVRDVVSWARKPVCWCDNGPAKFVFIDFAT